ncbi:MAG: phage portal protein [Lachnospiraceae bacterium]|nr:phage portal protein [Lachnospiraceae bacterium]
MAEKIRRNIQTWLRIQPAQISSIQLQEVLNYDGNAIKNRIWYRGDSEELSQLYKQVPGDRTRFWAAVPTKGMEIRKIHVGIPGVITDILTDIVISDMNDFDLSARQEEWEEISKENKFKDMLSEAITETLVIGDGAFKISFDTVLSQYPIVEFYPGDKIDIIYNRGRVKEIIFKSIYYHNRQEYVLLETYGKGYINHILTRDGRECDIKSIPDTADLTDIVWDDNFIMAVPLQFLKSSKWKGRGKSIFDGKTDAFDSLDEAWSQWMDALRANRTKEYIPTDLIPRNPNTGELLTPNAFDNRFLQSDGAMDESGKAAISLVQGEIPHESYLATYVTALDLCLQGLISPSTLGIDANKINDNALAQREKEKTTLYTRNKIVQTLQETLPELINIIFKSYDTWMKKPTTDIEVDVPFGEYANPSFESQVETVSKGKQGGIMSIEASVEELYGDTRDEEWKKEEVARLKAEQGIAEIEEPEVNSELGEFSIEMNKEPNTLPDNLKKGC